jgi:hypothetical protein
MSDLSNLSEEIPRPKTSGRVKAIYLLFALSFAVLILAKWVPDGFRVAMMVLYGLLVAAGVYLTIWGKH